MINITEVLDKHQKWLRNEDGGEIANLRGANLYSANLRGADLYSADLYSADLCGANLYVFFPSSHYNLLS